jgi:hypothetical protein
MNPAQLCHNVRPCSQVSKQLQCHTHDIAQDMPGALYATLNTLENCKKWLLPHLLLQFGCQPASAPASPAGLWQSWHVLTACLCQYQQPAERD